MPALMWRMQQDGGHFTKLPVATLTMLPRFDPIQLLVFFLKKLIFATTCVCLTQVVQLLVEHGAKVDVCDQRGGITPLHDAVSFGSREVVMALLEAGARAGRKMCD